MVRNAFLGIALCLSLSCCTNSPQPTGALSMNDKDLATDIAAVARLRVFFGHQSVGRNIIDGLNDLQGTGAGELLKVRSVESADAAHGPAFVEGAIGANGSPATKCEAFAAAVTHPAGDAYEVALMKFCYVDIEQGTDVEQLFDVYCAMVDSVKKKAPRTVIVHVTAPLTVNTPAWKKLAKTLLGRSDDTEASNALRCRFNDLMRSRFKGESFYDLAAIESTFPDGSKNSFKAGNAERFSLVGSYTDDGGHLNGAGRVRAARELLSVLSRVRTN
jgi:hypothetical protein